MSWFDRFDSLAFRRLLDSHSTGGDSARCCFELDLEEFVDPRGLWYSPSTRRWYVTGGEPDWFVALQTADTVLHDVIELPLDCTTRGAMYRWIDGLHADIERNAISTQESLLLLRRGDQFAYRGRTDASPSSSSSKGSKRQRPPPKQISIGEYVVNRARKPSSRRHASSPPHKASGVGKKPFASHNDSRNKRR